MKINSLYFGSIINLKPEYELQYKSLHSNTFPGVLAQIMQSNIRDYSIFYHKGLLFSHMCYYGENFDLDMQKMGKDKTTRDWWTLTDLMQQPVDNCPEGKWWADLTLIFEFYNSATEKPKLTKIAFMAQGEGNNSIPTLDLEHIKQELGYLKGLYTLKFYKGYNNLLVYAEVDEAISSFRFDDLLTSVGVDAKFEKMEQVFYTDLNNEPDNSLKKVFVTGCFDMLHSGHVAFLQEAAGYGDLYVSIGSDANVEHLKGRYPVNSEDERKYMISALSCVKSCTINSGWGIIDFEKELADVKPDIFVVNEDGHTPAKQDLCAGLGIEYKVLKRIPHADLPVRSTTALRTECTIPFRIDLAGGWLDQPFVSRFAVGSVLTISIEPTVEFNDRSGMSSSTRRKAIELWRNEIPHGDREQLARMLFSYENPPGTAIVAGSQDSLGIVLPGLNRLVYNANYWPESIQSVHDEDILEWIEEHLYLITLGPRYSDYDVLENTSINADKAALLAISSEQCWESILSKDLKSFGLAFRKSFDAQVAMFPNMIDESISRTIEIYQDKAYGWKLSGAGGGGYLILIAENPIEGAIKIKIRRKNNL